MSAPDLSSLSKGASDVLSSFGLVVPAVLLLLLAWATYRTGSAHLLLTRVWLLIFGKLDVSDQAIESFLANRDAFMKFKLVTGLKPRTLEQAKALIAWCDEHKEDVRDVKACGHFFDVEKLQLRDRLPGKRGMLALAILVFLFFYTAYVAGALAVFYPSAFRVPESGNWYWVMSGKATLIDPTTFDESYVDKATCRRELPTSGSGESELEVLCALIDDGSAHERASALASQRVIFAMGGAVAFLLGARVMLTRRSIKASWAMRDRLRDLQAD